jgi:O-glycosyl hydrolase
MEKIVFLWGFIFINVFGQNPTLISETIDLEKSINITIFPDEEYQTIRGFGASDAWSIQFVGKNWPIDKRNHIADLLFSHEMDSENNPLGIGLNQWRFNIGAGSMAQGENSGIKDIWRRAESFLNEDGYDWKAQEGQRWFIDAAKKRGVNQFIAFLNSPPVTMTKNNKAYSSGGTRANLEESKYIDYVDFLTIFLERFKRLYHVEFDYISPFNEPQWDWKKESGQEGSPWQNNEIESLTRLLDAKLIEKKLTTKIELAEAGQLNYLYQNANKKGRGNQIQEFFDPNALNYIGDLKTLAHKISGHSYYTNFDATKLISTRFELNNKLKTLATPLEFWMTEYCVLEKNEDIVGSGRDLGIDTALYVGRIIHADLTLANASAWQWWLAVSPYDYKDGLIYIDKNKNDGKIYESKLLWALGNYSRFIKSGYKRIGLKRSDGKTISESIKSLLVSTYKSQMGDQYIAVFVNQADSSKSVRCDIANKERHVAKIYQTSNSPDDNLSYKGSTNQNDVVNIPARSIVTLVIE